MDKRRTRAIISGATFGYSQGVIYWVFALLFYVGAILVDRRTIDYTDFLTAMFAVIFGAFGIGQVHVLLTSTADGRTPVLQRGHLELNYCSLLTATNVCLSCGRMSVYATKIVMRIRP